MQCNVNSQTTQSLAIDAPLVPSVQRPVSDGHKTHNALSSSVFPPLMQDTEPPVLLFGERKNRTNVYQVYRSVSFIHQTSLQYPGVCRDPLKSSAVYPRRAIRPGQTSCWLLEGWTV